MMFDLDSFFDWDKPAYTFSRPVHDMKPYSLKRRSYSQRCFEL